MESGSKLGHYEISTLLGKGGMGEVWRARDTKLGREVAIKTLPEEFAKDADRLARFEREAKLLASLNHPNIAAIHGFEEDNGTHFLVLELVEGATLADQLKRGAIPVEEALKFALQIAEALEAAHEKGVIHRDLKPANIKVTPEGKVKVLDFGLAKAFEGDPADPALSNSPTLSMAATQQGVILGTAAYMSPEQASGQESDKRTDIWAFGAVLFEMLAGEGLFSGETASHVLASVLKTEPDWNALPHDTPAPIARLLRRCLEKDRQRRLHDIADVRLDLEDVLASPSDHETIGTTSHAVVRFWKRPIVIATLVLLAAVLSGLTVRIFDTPETPAAQTTRFTVPVENGYRMTNGTDPPLALSPDGRTIAYVAEEMLHVRVLDRRAPRLLEGTEGAKAPFFSPDGQFIGFSQGNQIKRIPVGGGPITEVRGSNLTVAEASWGADGNIVYRPFGSRVLVRIPAAGGTPEPVTSLGEGETFHKWPQVLSGGRQILYTALGPSGLWTDAEIILEDLETGARSIVVEGGTYGRHVSSGHILYATSTGNVMVIPYDINRHEAAGDSMSVASDVPVAVWGGGAMFAASDGGNLLFAEGSNTIRTEYWWVNREGQLVRQLGEAQSAWWFDLSPDGSTLVTDLQTPSNHDIAVIDVSSGDRQRVTFDDAFEFSAIWSPEGDRVAFVSENVQSTIQVLDLERGGEPVVLYSSRPNSDLWVRSWSPDGEWLLFEEAPEGQGDIYALNVDDPERIIEIAVSPTIEGDPGFSPDGRWIAYGQRRLGQGEVYVVSFPEVGRPQEISSEGGERPKWSPTGDELFFWNGQTLMVSRVVLGESFSRDPAEPLFVLEDIERQTGGSVYAVGPEGNEFLVAFENPDWPATEIVVVENWLQEVYGDDP